MKSKLLQLEGISVKPNDAQNDTKDNQSKDSKNWEVVSSTDRVQGIIAELDMTADKLNSITLKATKRLPLPNPIDYDFTGKTFNIVFNDGNGTGVPCCHPA